LCKEDFVKKYLLLAVAFVAMGSLAFAAPKKAAAKTGGLEPLMAPGDLAITAGVGYGLLWGALDFSGGAEFMLGKFMIGETLPLTYGVAVKASYYSWNEGLGSDWHDTYLGAGAFGTLHLGLKDINLPENMGWLSNVDTFIGLGAGFYSWSYGWTGDTSSSFKVGPRTTAGVNYFITPNIAITTEGGYYGGWGGGLIGVTFKI